jgi:acetyltransferase-like isoleucine patch superfamily enzyme
MKLKQVILAILRCGLPDWAVLRAFYRTAYRCGILVYELSVWLKKVFLVEPTVRAICHRVGKRLRIECIPYMRRPGRIILGDDVYISGKIGIAFNAGLGLAPELRVGNHTFIGHQCSFSIAKGITIGDHCLIAGGVSFFDNDGHPMDAIQRRNGERVGPSDVSSVCIGNDVWIGAGSRILKGVTIADHAIVGASSVVTKDVASDTIVAGNPARVIGVCHHQTGSEKVPSSESGRSKDSD